MRIRSLLYVPASSERFLAKAHERGADAIILDLEDAVVPARKDAARERLDGAVAMTRSPILVRTAHRVRRISLPSTRPARPWNASARALSMSGYRL